MRIFAFALAACSALYALPVEPPAIGELPAFMLRDRVRRGKGKNSRRGRGYRAKPKKHPNRLTISKRVRRKHRRRA